MTWVFVIVLGLAALGAIVLLQKSPRGGWEAIGAALLFGIAGYGLQANPALEGKPKPPPPEIVRGEKALVDARGDVSEAGIPPSNRWVVIADGMARNGQFASAANVLLGAVEEDPKNGEAWLALANALVAHADGLLTPASFYAFEMASQADPEHPGPPFFLGMAMAQTGRFTEARSLWSGLLERSPEDAPWRSDLEERLTRLDSFIVAQERAQAGR